MIITVDDVGTWFITQQLTPAVRSRIYDTLALLLDNNVLLVDALTEMYAVASDDGRAPKRAEALMLYECRQMVSEGHTFSEAIAKWVGTEEGALIAAGEQSGNLRTAFADAMDLLAAKKQIKSVILSGTGYPLILCGFLCYLLYIVADKLVPSLSSAAPPDTWTGAARLMYLSSVFTTNYGVATLVAIVVTGVAIWLSFSRLTGNIRYRLDKYWPWSIYRTITGSTFLLNIAVLIRSGVKLHDALHLLGRHANAYLHERIDAAILGTTRGLNLGEALDAAEFDFPDREAVKLIRLLASRDGFDVALLNYSKAWLQQSVKSVSAAMRVFFFMAILGVGACAVMIVVAGIDIERALQTTTQRR